MIAPTSRNLGGSGRGWTLACALLVIFKLWLVAAQPVLAIGGAGHDDRLFLHLADKILGGHWLGAYNQLTLAKGPLYSLWIAATVIVGIPLPLAQHLLYLGGCVLVVRAVRPLLASHVAACGLFLLLWWNPMSYEMTVLGRVLRQNLYTPASLGFFAGLIALLTARNASRAVRTGWGILLGASGGALWLTREETIWVAPSAVLLAGLAAWLSWRAGERLRPLVLPVVAATATSAAMLLTVCALNLHYYGWFGTVEFRAPEFVRAYGALQRVKSSYEIPYVPVTREAREKIYAISPAFAELRPHLDGWLGEAWAGASSGVTHRPASEREMGGGWFMWALRDAVASAGHASSAREALAFYARIADEVNAACDRGELDARPRRDSFVPPWRPEFTAGLRREVPRALQYFVSFEGGSAFAPGSLGTAAELKLFSDLTRWPLAPSAEAPDLDRKRQQQFDFGRVWLLEKIGRGVGGALMIGSYGAVLLWGVLIVVALRRRKLPVTLVVAAAAGGGALAVVLINTVVDVVSFPNRSPGAFAQAYPLLILFVGLVWMEAVRIERNAVVRR